MIIDSCITYLEVTLSIYKILFLDYIYFIYLLIKIQLDLSPNFFLPLILIVFDIEILDYNYNFLGILFRKLTLNVRL